MAPLAVFKMPAFLLGTMISGWGAVAVYSGYAIVNLYLGTGILRLEESARLGGIAYFAFGILNGLVALLPPGWAARMELVQREMTKYLPAGNLPAFTFPGWIFALTVIVPIAIPIWFLVRRRAAFGSPESAR